MSDTIILLYYQSHNQLHKTGARYPYNQYDPMLGSLPLCQRSASYFTATRNYACVLKLLRIKGAAYDMDFRVIEK
uniref:AlNc14C78G5168 protein n=1 Tax=Albugo laibachii Nc14 TaxID=890382 RepID=F0WEX0_9STRA|nr:AlNc14C78G5168 [Albugo laibachii Nc14]|eukprot:CCA19752.1 AlNc14C78G5168 [Albugo laibachii Nc14]